MRVKMSKQPPPAPTASAVSPCPTVIQIVGRPGTGSLPSTFVPPDLPTEASGGADGDKTNDTIGGGGGGGGGGKDTIFPPISKLL